MTLARLLSILGALLIIYAVIFGFNFEFTSDFEETTFDSSYTFKVGSFILGVILIIIGRRMRKPD
jgi:uncharacterized membrane protein